MFNILSYDEFSTLAQQHRRIAVYQEISGDRITPIHIYQALQKRMRGATLLESSPREKHLGRYSFLGFHPLAEIRSKGQQVTIQDNGQPIRQTAHPLDVVRDYQKRLGAATSHRLSGFVGGMAALVAYDAIRLFERIPDRHLDDLQTPDLTFKFYRDNITFDHQSGTVVLSTTVEVNGNARAAYDTARERLAELRADIFAAPVSADDDLSREPQTALDDAVETDMDDDTYARLVEQARHYIRQGDIFQVVPSRQFRRRYQAKPFDIYRALRICSPSPYMFYVDQGSYAVAGASPEKLISVRDGIVETCPLAGTRPRGEGDQDLRYEQDLLADEKETAEHMMLVDLARNDVGRVAVPGSVTVSQLKAVQRFSHVMHLSSTVQGRLRPDLDVLDALAVSFPAGTLSGAPKIRAMEIIDELEQSRRGLYGGGVCIVDSHGNLDSCIAIRMALLKDGLATVRTGAGIVYDSDPHREAEETRHKARSVLEAIALAEGGL